MVEGMGQMYMGFMQMLHREVLGPPQMLVSGRCKRGLWTNPQKKWRDNVVYLIMMYKSLAF